MKLPDVNLLLYAYNSDSPHHEGAALWLEDTLSGVETVALSWPVMLAFLRLSTSSRIMQNPMGIQEAFDVVESWMEQPCTAVVHPDPTPPLRTEGPA